MCTISVIIVVYNSEKTIEKSIESFLQQDYSSKELIIIDGGSSDGTVKIIEKYSDSIAYWVSEPDCGIYDAMNKGIVHATGQYIAFLGADDYYLDNVFERVNRIIQKNSGYRLFCFNVLWNIDGEIKSVPVQSGFYKPKELRYNVNMFPHQAIFAKRDLFVEYGFFNIEYQILADYEWLLRVCNRGETFYSQNLPVVAFGKSGISSIQRKKALLECGDIMHKAAKLTHEVPYKYTASQISQRFYISLLEYLNTDEEMRFTQGVISTLKKKNVLIFGSGENGKTCCMWLEKCDINVVEFWDNNVTTEEILFGKNVRKPRLVINNGDLIIITCYDAFFEVYDQLECLGFQFGRDFIGAGALVMGCGE